MADNIIKDFIRSMNLIRDIFKETPHNSDYEEQRQNFSSDNKNSLEIIREYGLPTDKKNYWWVRYSERAIEEIEKMNKDTKAKLFVDVNKLIWQEYIINNFGTEFLISIETEDFPHKMPRVILIEPKIEPCDGIHLLSGGVLCLMDSWDYNTKMSVIDFRNFAAAWCFCIEVYVNTREWPAAQH